MRANHRITWRLRDGERVTDGYGPLNLLAHAEAFEIPLAQACGGQAECGTCRVRVVSGALTEPTPDEQELMATHRRRFGQGERLACQCRPRGDVVVALPGRCPQDLRST